MFNDTEQWILNRLADAFHEGAAEKAISVEALLLERATEEMLDKLSLIQSKQKAVADIDAPHGGWVGEQNLRSLLSGLEKVKLLSYNKKADSYESLNDVEEESLEGEYTHQYL